MNHVDCLKFLMFLNLKVVNFKHNDLESAIIKLQHYLASSTDSFNDFKF